MSKKIFTITLSSSQTDVQNFLSSERFGENIKSNFSEYDGRALLGATDDAIIRSCGGNKNGDRLIGILNSIKKASTGGKKS